RPAVHQALKALVRRPSSRLGEGIVTHVERLPVDAGRARGQWEAYVGALEDAGWQTVEAPPADDCPDAVFVEDAVVVFGHVAVVDISEFQKLEGCVTCLSVRLRAAERDQTRYP